VDGDTIAPMVIMLAVIFTAGGVLLFRPLTRRLGDLIEASIEAKRRRPEREADERLRDALDSIDRRLSLLEERVNFQESLLAERRRPKTLEEPPERW
jgi:hypothetical protein